MRNYYYDPNVFIEQARAVSTDGLRPSFFTINAAVYVVQVKISAPLFHFSSGQKGALTTGKQVMFSEKALQLCSVQLIFLSAISLNRFS